MQQRILSDRVSDKFFNFADSYCIYLFLPVWKCGCGMGTSPLAFFLSDGRMSEKPVAISGKLRYNCEKKILEKRKYR